MIQAINPATDEVLRICEEMEGKAVEETLAAMNSAQKGWRRESFASRAKPMRAAAGELRKRKEELARLMALEMGKPISQGRGEIEKCASVCEYYADNAEGLLAPEDIKTEASRTEVLFQPLGIVLAVMPWNFPFWQVFRAAAPALMAGNGLALKHASNVPGCALAIEEVMRAAGFPKGLFQSLLLGARRATELIAHPLIRAVTLTGSTPAGRAVAEKAGAMLKKTVLELGGSDPYLVLEDADLESAAEVCATARLINSGQSCIAAKRFIVVQSVRGKFEELFTKRMAAREPGDPLLEETRLGPMARRDLRDQLHVQVQKSAKEGARVLLGGEPTEGAGAFYPSTVLTDVTPDMTVFREETFGPVAAITEVRDEADAIRLANQTVFGLGAAVFTRDADRGHRVATELEAGCCFVNDFVRSDPRLPFGGVKESGFGRELGSYGLREFVNVKTVWVK